MEVTAKTLLYRRYTSYTATQLYSYTVNSKPPFVTLHCDSYVFRPQHGHLQGDLQRRNKIMTDQFEDVQMCRLTQSLHIKLLTIFRNIGLITNFLDACFIFRVNVCLSVVTNKTSISICRLDHRWLSPVRSVGAYSTVDHRVASVLHNSSIAWDMENILFL